MFTYKQAETFWNKVDVKSKQECWNWLGSLDRYGYGKVKIGDRVYISHRVAYSLGNGVEFPSSDQHVLHKCDNSMCCNPNHFFIGTHADNMKDMSRKGRRGKAKNFSHKMNQQKADQLREDFASGLSKHALSRKYDICPKHVRDILSGTFWKRSIPFPAK